MVEITISVTAELSTKFQVAVEHYNQKNETDLTPKEMVKKLARQFTIDTIREIRVAEGQVIGESEVEGL
jgi:ribosomal protein L13E